MDTSTDVLRAKGQEMYIKLRMNRDDVKIAGIEG